MKNRRLLPVCLLAVLIPVNAAARGPSTAAERERAVRLAHMLETEPLGKKADEARRWLAEWIQQIPDITVPVCRTLLAPVPDSMKHADEIRDQMIYSSAAFMIEHPERGDDDLAIYLAGVNGALHVYAAIVERNPRMRLPLMDGLLEKRELGELEGWVGDGMASCGTRFFGRGG